ncbi:hypothetical protein BBJ29_003630 [Phytophthora kernoviae]|uniref:Inositol-3,4-bisphosphate 4-phosphatase n=1 Tax=Phytophthora kernoviae TaxID=325452 RepID=A0A3F2RL26_9STRA|nr:hypothetical protein BBJ29_003630 [Phytophthora kernoviae]RLN59551.1 hypothetical protein BBP00_00006431 [Phytophthora kernoviae]
MKCGIARDLRSYFNFHVMEGHAGPQSPNLMFFDDEPAAPTSVSSTESFDASTSLPAPSSPVEIAPPNAFQDAQDDRKVLHFFVSCRSVDGNSLVSPARSAQTLVRGAFNMLSTAAAMNSNKSPRAKAPTEVNVEVRVARETPIFGFGTDFPVQPAAQSNGLTVEMDNLGELGRGFSDKAALPSPGLLDSESYWSERHKSRNPRFSVGFSVRCKTPAEYDRHVQVMVMIPDEGSTSNRNSQVFGYALTSFQEMYTVAISGNFQQKMTLPVHSTVLDGATVEIQFADIQPQKHPLFHAQHNLFRSFLFYPLMREEHVEMQAANAKLAVEEAAEVEFSVKIPLQLLRVCQYELLQMYDDWKARYNFNRMQNRYFENDAEALNFGHDVFSVQVICGRGLRAKPNASSTTGPGASGTGTGMELEERSSRSSGFSMGMVSGRGGFVNRIKHDNALESEIPPNFLYPHVLNIRKQVTEVTDMIRLCEHLVEEKKTFKSSLHKKRADIQAIPTNLHVSYFRIFRNFSSQCMPPLMDGQASTEDLLGLEDTDAHVDAAPSNNPSSPMAAATPSQSDPTSKKKTSKYSIMARKAAAARAKALSKNRFGIKKSSRNLDRKESGDKAADAYAKYPNLRIDPEEGGGDPTTSVNYAVRMLCRFEMLRTEYYLRKSVAVSQSVSSLVTCFMAELDLCLQEQNKKVLDQMARIGFLIGWESLISSHGKELHMISDAWVAIKCLETFAFKLFEGTGMEVLLEKHEEIGYIIKVPVPPEQFAVLPESLRHGGLISVTAVLFTQGINEMQSLANMVGHSGVSVQRKINSTSFQTIVEYYNRFTEVCGIGMSEASVGSHPDEILRNLRVSVESENSASKNTCILLHAADAVRSLNGGRVTYCKSGKDRTAMSTTLEQARLLVQRKRHVLQEIESGNGTEYGPLEEVKDVANTMREFGVRIHVAKKNVGRFKYSFNSLQRKLLPEIYRPPMSTIQDMVTSVTARDS